MVLTFVITKKVPFQVSKTDTKKATIPVLKTALNMDKKKFLRRLLIPKSMIYEPETTKEATRKLQKWIL